jgi:putative membrane protein
MNSNPTARKDTNMKAALLLGTCMFICVPVWAQSAGERTGANAALGVTPKAADFVTEAAASDMFEIQSSKLAASKTQGELRTFANQMVTDHTKTTTELMPIAKQAQIIPPARMSSAQQGKLDKLRAANGKDFTNLYIDDQVSAHKDAISLFQRYGSGGDNPQLKGWAMNTLPALQEHLNMAQRLQKVTMGSR